MQGVSGGATEACAYACSDHGRREAPTVFGLALGNQGFGSLMSYRPAASGGQEIELTQPPGKKRRWPPARTVSHRYRVYPGTCKRSVSSRVPTHFRPESPVRVGKPFVFNAPVLQQTLKYAHRPQTQARASGCPTRTGPRRAIRRPG